MRVYGGDNYHAFWDKHLFYVLFVRPTSIYVYGGPTFSDDGVGLVPIILPGSPKLYSLAPDYWTPTDLTRTLSLSAVKLYSGFHWAYHGAL